MVQKVVTDGNKAALEATDEEAIVKAVNEAKTQVALLEALKPFERVNADWIAAYETAIFGTTSVPVPETSRDTIKKIQGLVNGVNTNEVNTLTAPLSLNSTGLTGTASIDKDKLNKAKAAVEAYMTPDAEGVTDKADTLFALDRQLAIVAVLEAETPAQLSVAIDNLSALDLAFELDMDEYKDANRQAYIDAFKATGVTPATDLNTIAKINAKIVSVNGTQANAPIDDIKAATTADELLKALKAYDEVKYVADANKDFYAANITGGFDTVSDKDSVQALIDKCNLDAVVAHVTTPDADKLYAALVAYGNDIKDLSINNKAEYLNVAVGAGETTATGLSNAAEGFANITTSTATPAQIQALVDIANIEAIKAQTNATGVLAKLNITRAKGVDAANAKAYLAEVYDTTTATPNTTGAIGKLNGGASAERTIDNLETAIKAVNTEAVKAVSVKALNAATTATEVRDILTEMAVEKAITVADYVNLSSADKLLVAELFMDDDVFASTTTGLVATRTAKFGKYNETTVATGLSAIQSDLLALVTPFKALASDMNTVFANKAVGSVTIADVQTELAKLVKANYTAYDELTGTQKLAVAEAFIAGFPTYVDDADGIEKYKATAYSSVSAYFAAVDAAIAAIK
jgi:hypothetical protein